MLDFFSTNNTFGQEIPINRKSKALAIIDDPQNGAFEILKQGDKVILLKNIENPIKRYALDKNRAQVFSKLSTPYKRILNHKGFAKRSKGDNDRSLVFEYSKISLMDIHTLYRQTQRYPNETVLWKLLKDMLRAGEELQNNSLYHPGFTLNNILVDGPHFKLSNPFMHNTFLRDFSRINAKLSPEEVKDEANKNIKQLGLVLLGISSMAKEEELRLGIDLDNDNISKALSITRLVYSTDFYSLVVHLLKGKLVEQKLTFKEFRAEVTKAASKLDHHQLKEVDRNFSEFEGANNVKTYEEKLRRQTLGRTQTSNLRISNAFENKPINPSQRFQSHSYLPETIENFIDPNKQSQRKQQQLQARMTSNRKTNRSGQNIFDDTMFNKGQKNHNQLMTSFNNMAGGGIPQNSYNRQSAQPNFRATHQQQSRMAYPPILENQFNDSQSQISETYSLADQILGNQTLDDSRLPSNNRPMVLNQQIQQQRQLQQQQQGNRRDFNNTGYDNRQNTNQSRPNADGIDGSSFYSTQSHKDRRQPIQYNNTVNNGQNQQKTPGNLNQRYFYKQKAPSNNQNPLFQNKLVAKQNLQLRNNNGAPQPSNQGKLPYYNPRQPSTNLQIPQQQSYGNNNLRNSNVSNANSSSVKSVSNMILQHRNPGNGTSKADQMSRRGQNLSHQQRGSYQPLPSRGY